MKKSTVFNGKTAEKPQFLGMISRIVTRYSICNHKSGVFICAKTQMIVVNLMLSGVFRNRGKSCSIPFCKMDEEKDCGNYCLCGHARNWMHITADGFIVPCIPMGSAESGRKQFPNIHDTTIVEALSDSAYM